MSAKQDRQGARTVPDLERKYKFGESFAEVMGIATDARKAAELAQDAAENPSAKLTQDEIFNLLTNNGANQGIYQAEDGEIYFNASYLKSGIIDAAIVKVVNLIAERLQSVKGVQKLDVDGAGLDLSYAGNVIASLNTDSFGKSYLNVTEVDESSGKFARDVQIYGGTVTASCNEELFNGSIDQAILGIDYDGNGFVQARKAYLQEIKDKKIQWKDNGDGTFTLIGT